MKYRRLRLDELEEVEEKFVQFLAANGIASEDWQKMKDTQKDKADEMIDIFSDFVFENAFDPFLFLEYATVISCVDCASIEFTVDEFSNLIAVDV